jgi:aminopeptidase N
MRACVKLALLSLTLCASAATAQGQASQPGFGVDILSHELEITPDFESKSLSGRVRITLTATQDQLREIVFSKNSLLIENARLNGLPAAVERDGGKLIFVSPKPLKKGERVTLTALFSGKPARGIVFGEQSVFTSYWACDWMICSQDAPGDKATFSLRLTLPPGYKSISIGNLRSARANGNGQSIHIWRETRPYSSYLYGFAAGPFKEEVDRTSGKRLTSVDATDASPVLTNFFGSTSEMVRFLEEKAGVKLPSRRYTQLLVAGSEAQEAATYSVIGIKQIEPALKDPMKDWVVVHELAHQWWGNLVTCKNWDHFWLNEGMAVFMTAAWKEHRFGKAAYQEELDVARSRLARLKETGEERPLAFAGAYPSLAARRAIQYGKGALFLDHLRTLLGEKIFWAGLKHYTKEHVGGVVESRDFQRALEKESKLDLSSTFNEWVYGSGA